MSSSTIQPQVTTKYCSGCRSDQALSEFQRSTNTGSTSTGGSFATCKTCRERQKAIRERAKPKGNNSTTTTSIQPTREVQQEPTQTTESSNVGAQELSAEDELSSEDKIKFARLWDVVKDL